MNRAVFVYGTLMFSEVMEPITGVEQGAQDAVLEGYARYSVNDREDAQAPAIVETPGATVCGKLYRDLDGSALAALDRFEGLGDGKYERRTVRVTLAGGEQVTAEVYVAGPRARACLSGIWDPELFAQHELEEYVRQVVVHYRRED